MRRNRIILFPFIFLWRLLKIIFLILWHPLTLVVATVWFNTSEFQSGSLTKLYVTSTPVDRTELILTVAGLALYGLGVGSHIVTRRIIRHSALPTLVMSVFLAVGLSWYFVTFLLYGNHALLFLVNLILLIFISAGTAIITVYRYLTSRRPGPLISSITSDIRSAGRAFVSVARWIGTHRLIVGLIVIQFAINAFLLFRIAGIESRFGGSLFTTCNTEQSIQAIKHSIVRVESDQGEGTGMFIRQDGYVLTNAHVVADDPSPKIVFSDYSFKTSTVIFRDKDKDIAVVKVDGSGYDTLTLADPKGLASQTTLYSVGYPLGTTLRGDATVTDYTFTTVRTLKDVPTDMVQLIGLATGGSSGAPVTTSCGEVIGMFTSGSEGISFAISSKSIQDTIGFLSDDPSTWPKPPEYPLQPDKSAEEAVSAFYTFIKMRDFKRAYLMLTPERVKDNPLDNWVKGYAKTLDVTLVSVGKDNGTPMPSPTVTAQETSSGILKKERVYVRIRSLDLVGQDVVVKYFEGPWIVVYDGEFWRLSDSNIKPVPEPGWDWF